MLFRLALLLAATPLLLAPVRLSDSTPAFFQPAAQSPAAEAFSLPPAAPLTTPTVIPVTPTRIVTSPTLPFTVSPATVSGSQPQVIIQKVYVPSAEPMNAKSAALCQRALILVGEMAMLTYQQKPSKALMALAFTASAAAAQATARTWPDLTAFDDAAEDLPWFYPNKTELQDALGAARALCRR